MTDYLGIIFAEIDLGSINYSRSKGNLNLSFANPFTNEWPIRP